MPAPLDAESNSTHPDALDPDGRDPDGSALGVLDRATDRRVMDRVAGGHAGALAPAGAPLVLTTGYLAPGIEMVLHAMVLLRSEHPDLHYVVAAPTHPTLARRDGERYRWCIEALADDLGLADRVVLVDRSLDPGHHDAVLQRCDAVMVPYRSAEYAVRHTALSAAVAARPIIVTRPCAPAAAAARAVTVTIDVDDDEGCAAAIHHVIDPVRLGRLVGPHAMQFRPASLS